MRKQGGLKNRCTQLVLIETMAGLLKNWQKGGGEPALHQMR